MAKSWFAVQARAGGVGSISIYENIGADLGGIGAKDFSDALAKLGSVSRLNVFINSNGGDVSTGFAIFNILKRHTARKVVTIDGIAASMASVIAMAGDDVLMPSNAMLMVHEPFGVAAGGAEEIASFGEGLDRMRTQIADAYANRTGLTRERVLSMMARETWLDAEEAVRLGFADRVIAEMQMAAHVDLSKFKNPPQGARRKPQSLEEIRARAFSKWNAPRRRSEDDEERDE